MLRKMFVLAVILVLACGWACAVPSNLTIDLGEIADNVKISTEFKFTNIGDKTLEISKVTLSCPSCSEAKAELLEYIQNIGHYQNWLAGRILFLLTISPSPLTIHGKT